MKHIRYFLLLGLLLLPLLGASCQPATTTDTKDDTMMEDDTMHDDDAMMDDNMDEDMMNDGDDAMIDDEMADKEGEYMDGTTMPTDYSLDLSNFKFEPNLIEMKAGETIKVRLESTQGNHDFVIDELSVQSTVLNTGASEVIEITAPADSAGTEYAFYCSVGRHRENGMEGVLKITE